MRPNSPLQPTPEATLPEHKAQKLKQEGRDEAETLHFIFGELLKSEVQQIL